MAERVGVKLTALIGLERCYAWLRVQGTGRLRWLGMVVVSCAAVVLGVIPLAPTAAAAGAWTLSLGTPSSITTTGALVNGTVDPNGDAGSVDVVYEPEGTPITASSPTAGQVSFNTGVTTPQTVSIPVDQLTPGTSYTYELRAEDDNSSVYDSAPGTFTTASAPTGPGTPIVPPNNPPANGIFGVCSTDPACVNDVNGVRAAQEQLPPLALPSNGPASPDSSRCSSGPISNGRVAGRWRSRTSSTRTTPRCRLVSPTMATRV